MPKKKKDAEYMTYGGSMFLFREDPGIEKFKEESKKQQMSFLLCEGFLNKMIEYANRQASYPEENQEYWKGFKFACSMWFDYCKEYCEDFPPKMRKPTAAEKRKFKYVKTLEDGEKYEWPLVGVIDYRDAKIPVYDDDAGQCYFCKLPDGQEVCGGGWNPDPESEFCWAYDNNVIK